MKKIRIGGGAGFAGDRVDAAVELIEKGKLDYIIFECLAERTIGLARQEMLKDPSRGYSRLLEYRMSQVLEPAKRRGVKIITNMGAVNPVGAVAKMIEIAGKQGISGLKFAAVTGDSVFEGIEKYFDAELLEIPGKVGDLKDVMVSANAYIGAEGIMEALKAGADVIVTGRVSDPTLTIAPLRHEFGWTIEDADKIGQAVLAGHLIECAGQVTGGYYADPGYKDVPGLERLGFPFVEFGEDGSFIVSKVEGTGGLVSVDTCKEQMLYEIHDPGAYKTPDAIADFNKVKFVQAGKDIVQAMGATSHGAPEQLKVNICYRDSVVCECEISYGGSNAMDRARLAADMFLKRLDILGVEMTETRTDFVGFDSLYMGKISAAIQPAFAPEIRLRVAVRTRDRANADLVNNEFDSVYTNGPSGGGGATMKISDIVSVCSFFIPRTEIHIKNEYEVI